MQLKNGKDKMNKEWKDLTPREKCQFNGYKGYEEIIKMREQNEEDNKYQD